MTNEWESSRRLALSGTHQAISASLLFRSEELSFTSLIKVNFNGTVLINGETTEETSGWFEDNHFIVTSDNQPSREEGKD
jgi:hypothetical protein